MSTHLRVAVLGLSHEANSFSAQLADEAYMREAGIQVGDAIAQKHAGGTSTISGYLAAASADTDVQLVPLVMTNLIPRGPITTVALAARATEMTAALTERGPFDAVLVGLHGAAVAEDLDDVDGHLLERIRRTVGPNVTIGVSLDLHANISQKMMDNCDVANTFRTNPHIDAHEVATEVAELVFRTARGEIRPALAFEPIPAVISILQQNTGDFPMCEVMAEVGAMMRRPGVLSATVAEGYPYADVPEMGMSAIVITDGDPDSAAAYVRELAEGVWRRRHDFDSPAPTPEEAIAALDPAPARPALLLDVGDNIGGGSPGDSVVLLNAARAAGFASLLVIVSDSNAAACCHAAGCGSTVSLTFGAREHAETGPPVSAEGRVLALHDGVFEATEEVHAGMRHFDAGPSAAVELDTRQTVILTSRAEFPFSTNQLRVLGLVPEQFAAIVAKGVHSPLAGYGPYVGEIVRVDTPGVTSADLRRLPYVKRRRPLYPFETDAAYSTEEAG